MANEERDETEDGEEEIEDVNQYGGSDQDIDAVEQTERREDDVETDEETDDSDE